GTRLTPTQLAYAAIRGMTESFKDSHTGFLTPQQNAERRSRQRGQAGFTGVGIILLPKDDKFFVWAVIPGGPAEAMGVRAFDRILRVNETSTTGMTVDQVSGLIRGAPGTPVTLTLQRPGSPQTLSVTITRAPIVVPSIFRAELLENGVGYIRLYQFVEGTARDFRLAVSRLVDQRMRSLILDLRGNGGGYLHELNGVLNAILPAGTPVYTEMRQGGQTRRVTTTGTPILPQVPVVQAGAAERTVRIAAAPGTTVVRDGHLLARLSVFEQVGASVRWDPRTPLVSIQFNGTTVELLVGVRSARVNGRAVALPVPALRVAHDLFVPVRFVAEAIGARVYFEARTRTAFIRWRSSPPTTTIPLPLYVLIDEGSASAAELLSAALGENRRAQLIGGKTAGAVEASIMVDLSDGSALSVTTFRLATGGGVRLEGVGVVPDVEAGLSSQDLEAGYDRPLAVALELARQSLAQHGR
ncbi:MAG TPA: S41 family peptidase, partial [bacterium]|nr:S41 family peptidase [bacterium]